MKFDWAVKQLKLGKKVRRPSWGEDSYWKLGVDDTICWTDGRNAHVHLNQIEATDWEFYEDEKEEISRIIKKAVKSFKPLTKKEKDYFDKWYKKEFGDIKNEK